jgi:parvulin-like peptidyl-prolyl isomerase
MFPISNERSGCATDGGRGVRSIRISDLKLVLLGLLIALNGVGCNALNKKHDNPVLSQAPRRVDHVEPEEGAQVAESDEKPENKLIQVVGTLDYNPDPWAGWVDDTAVFNSKVAATVNGAPILNGDVLDRYGAQLISIREAMQKERVPPEAYKNYREMIIQRDIVGHIQRRLLVERMRSSMKAEQVKSINGHIDSLFEKRVEELKQSMKVSTRTELELELNKKGSTLQNVKDDFATEQMAMGYMQHKMEKPQHIDRMDLVEYYQNHPDEFLTKANVQWAQIQVSFGVERTEADAEKRIAAARKEIESGVPFADVAAKYSDGLTAKSGGVWESMEKGNLADTKLEKLLFEAPIGELSRIHKGPSEFQLFRVLARKSDGRKPLGEVQEEIRAKMEADQNNERPRKLLKQLFKEAVIETKYQIPMIDS